MKKQPIEAQSAAMKPADSKAMVQDESTVKIHEMRVLDELYISDFTLTAFHYLWQIYTNKNTSVIEKLFGSPGCIDNALQFWHQGFQKYHDAGNKDDFELFVRELFPMWEPDDYECDYRSVLHKLKLEAPNAAPYYLVELALSCHWFVHFNDHVNDDHPWFETVEKLVKAEEDGQTTVFSGRYDELMFTIRKSGREYRQVDDTDRCVKRTLPIAKAIIMQTN